MHKLHNFTLHNLFFMQSKIMQSKTKKRQKKWWCFNALKLKLFYNHKAAFFIPALL